MWIPQKEAGVYPGNPITGCYNESKEESAKIYSRKEGKKFVFFEPSWRTLREPPQTSCGGLPDQENQHKLMYSSNSGKVHINTVIQKKNKFQLASLLLEQAALFFIGLVADANEAGSRANISLRLSEAVNRRTELQTLKDRQDQLLLSVIPAYLTDRVWKYLRNFDYTFLLGRDLQKRDMVFKFILY